MQATCLCVKMASIEKMQFSSQWHFKTPGGMTQSSGEDTADNIQNIDMNEDDDQEKIKIDI